MTELAQFRVPELEDRVAHALKGVAGHRRGDIGVAVAIASDPGPVAEDRGEVVGDDLGLVLAEGSLCCVHDVAEQARDGLPDRGREEVDPIDDLVGDTQTLGADLIGEQHHGHDPVEALGDLFASACGE